MAIWTDLPTEIRLPILAYVFSGRSVYHISCLAGLDGRYIKRCTDFTTLTTVAKTFVNLNEVTVSLLRSAEISLPEIWHIFKLHESLSYGHRTLVRSLRLQDCRTAPDYAELDLARLKDYFPRLRTINFGKWPCWDSVPDLYIRPKPISDVRYKLDLEISYHSRLAQYIYLKYWEFCNRGTPERYTIDNEPWPSMSQEEARDTFDMAMELRDDLVPKKDAESLLTRVFKEKAALPSSTIWRLALLLDAANFNVDVTFDTLVRIVFKTPTGELFDPPIISWFGAEFNSNDMCLRLSKHGRNDVGTIKQKFSAAFRHRFI